MLEFGFLDYLMIIGAMAVSWSLYYAKHPPPADRGDDSPSAVLHTAGLGDVDWAKRTPPTADIASELGTTLQRIVTASGYREVGTFLDGAKAAYEAIITSFARGDIASDAYLLSPPLRHAFDEAIAARNGRHETVDLVFIGFRACDIVDAGLAAGLAWIEVRFVGEMVSVTRDAEGRTVAGDAGRVIDIAELWTFERELRSSASHWLLIATEADE